jgi:hypothetical protein
MTYRLDTFYGMFYSRLVENITSPQLAWTGPRRPGESYDRMPCGGELSNQSAADESGGTSNENAHIFTSWPELASNRHLSTAA